jgi:hypothetical protein
MWKEGSWSNFMVLFGHSPVKTGDNLENVSQGNRSQGRDLKPGSPEYETGVLTTRPHIRQAYIAFSYVISFLKYCLTWI